MINHPRPSTAFPYCKRQKAGWGLGTRLCHLNYGIISDCLHHETIAVSKIYFSDGAACQYKNQKKNFVSLWLHKDDFGISAEWHFSATSHGKGACDGLGGTVKRLGARASLQRPYNDQIITPHQLFGWASTAVPSVHFGYRSMEDYEREQHLLEQHSHQFHLKENCTHLFPSQTVKLESVTIQLLTLPGRRELL